MSLYFLSVSFSLSLFLSLSPLWRCSRGAPQGWAQCTDKQSTHGDPGHPSQNKQQEDVYLCPFHWPWPLLLVRGPALSIATTLPLFLSSGRVALLKTCSKLFKIICIALFMIHLLQKQLYRKLSFYNRFIYCRNLIYLTYGKMWLIQYTVWGLASSLLRCSVISDHLSVGSRLKLG